MQDKVLGSEVHAVFIGKAKTQMLIMGIPPLKRKIPHP